MNTSRSSSSNGKPLPPTVVECFTKPLPSLHGSPQKYESVQPSSTSTASWDPPSLLRWQSLHSLNSLARQTLLSNKIMKPAYPSKLLTASEFEGLSLDLEAEVVCASMLYVIRPILEVLRELYPGQWVMNTERSAPINVKSKELNPKTALKKGAKTKEESGKRQASVRYDLIFRTSEKHPDPGKTIAILEYKKREMIRFKDFEKALVDPPPKMAEEDFERKVKMAKNDEASYPSLRGNALSYIKQVAAYAKTEKCRHAALFNWDHLLVLDFVWLEGSGAGSAGDLANMSWVTEGKSPSSTVDSKGVRSRLVEDGIIRYVLLGWIRHAFTQCGGWPENI